MLTNLKKEWRAFRKGRPGRRFQEHHDRAQKDRAEKPLLLRVVQPLIGGLLLVAGIVFLLIPGPGLPLVLVGGGLLAGRFLFLARAMDWCEVQVRKGMRWVKRLWRRVPRVAKA